MKSTTSKTGMPDTNPFGRAKQAMVEDFTFPENYRHHRIAQAAYYLAERRGFAPGHELEDWMAAERGLYGTDRHSD
jgi:hypothetical protein